MYFNSFNSACWLAWTDCEESELIDSLANYRYSKCKQWAREQNQNKCGLLGCFVAWRRVYVYLEVPRLGHAMGRVCSFQNCKNNSNIKTIRFFHFRKYDVSLWCQLCFNWKQEHREHIEELCDLFWSLHKKWS